MQYRAFCLHRQYRIILNILDSNHAPDWNKIPATCLLKAPKLVNDTELHCDTDSGTIAIQLFPLAMRLFSLPESTQDYGLIVQPLVPQSIKIKMQEDSWLVSSTEFDLVVHDQPFSFQLHNKQGKLLIQSTTDGHFVREHRVPPLAKLPEGWLISTALQSNEAIYGLGEKWTALNKRGQLLRSYNHDALGVNAEISYKNIPFGWSPKGWGSLYLGTSPVTHAVGYAPWSQRSYCQLIEDDDLDILLMVAPEDQTNKAAALIQNYCQLTGFAPVPPDWSLGIILSKAYYQNADEILAVAKDVRARKMPCDVITFDGRAWQDTETRFAFEWDASRYPDPAKVIDQLKAMDFKICVWEYPLISISHPWFKMFADKGWLLKDVNTDEVYEYHWDKQAFGQVLTALPVSGIVDFTHPEAYDFWREAHRPLFELGVDMVKADFGEQIEDNMLASNGTTGKQLHNVYSHLYNRCVFEACEKYSASGAFLFSRCAWTGSQRYNSHWGGDPQADWEGMMSNIRGGISWGLSGAPFYATDVGGFYKDKRDDKLYVRWAQAAIYSAHFRLHGIGPREPWSYSDAASQAVFKALRLRHQLHDYLKQTVKNATETGLPVQRAMVLAYPQEPQSWGFENQFMFGEQILVVPCFSADDSVEFYLPRGDQSEPLLWQPFNPQNANPTNSGQQAETLIGGKAYRRTLALDEMAVFIIASTNIALTHINES